MNENKETKKEKNDEISFIYIFTVLLRYRKLIIYVTMLSVVLAIAGYYIYPILQYKKNINEKEFQGRMIISMDANVRRFISRNIDSYFKNAEIIFDSFKDTGMTEFEYIKGNKISLINNEERGKALYIFDQYFVKNKYLNGKENKKFKILTNPTSRDTGPIETVVRDSYSIEIIFINESRELIKSFFYALYARGNTTVSENLKPLAERVKYNYESLISGTSTADLNFQVFGMILENFLMLDAVLNNDFPPLILVGEPVITEPIPSTISALRRDFVIKAIIIVFAGFILSVCLAFALNTVRNIKNNDEVMQKIRAAFGRTDS